MSEQADARRMKLLETIATNIAGIDLQDLARQLEVDDRTVRRDVSYLQDIVAEAPRIELAKGRVSATKGGISSGYFSDQMGNNLDAKQAIARSVVASLGDNMAITLTAGSTTYYIAREIRRATLEDGRPHNLIAFTNSLPALLELIAAGISTGVLGDVYNADDNAFHSHEYHSAFHPSIAILGASGVVANPTTGRLDLFSHRAEEAAFLKQMLLPVPEFIVAVDSVKLGRWHPWSFTDGGVLAGKTVRLFTNLMTGAQREILDQLVESARRVGCIFSYVESGVASNTLQSRN